MTGPIIRSRLEFRPIVLAHGCFDLLHLGHIRHLEEAKKLGVWLVVSVTPDAHVNKGAGRPRFTAAQRAEALRALACVDEVVINEGPDAIPLIERLQPDIYVKGPDYAGALPRELQLGLGRELAALERCGGRFVTTTAEKWSSSRLIAGETYSPEALAYLDHARSAGFLDRIEAAFDKAARLSVLFVGEAITDEYVYVSPLSKPSKEFVLAGAEAGVEVFEGGIDAAAGHLQGFCRVAGVLSQPVEMQLVKRRYVEQGFNRKLFEVYSARGLRFEPDQRARFLSALQQAVPAADAVITIDFGHGLIDGTARSILDLAGFLAVNAQTNAGNQGFNPVTRYCGADYVCVDLPEARLAAQQQDGDPAELVAWLHDHLVTRHVVVTQGRDGAHCSAGHVPAFATKPVDTMGAGDCFLAYTAVLIAAGLGTEEAAFVGSVAGGLKTGIVGHREPVRAETLRQTIRALLQ